MKLEDVLFPKNLRLDLQNLKYLPRWIILSIDMAVIIFTFLFSNVIFKSVDLSYILIDDAFKFTLFFILVNIVFFRIFRTYSGIIRHTSLTDAVRLFYAQSSVFILFVFLHFLSGIFFKMQMVSIPILFINILLSFCALFSYRVLVKQVYEIYFSKHADDTLIKTVIYGTDANALSIANALKFETPIRFKIVGFVDKNRRNASKRMLDLPILIQRKKLPTLMRSVKAEAVIFADKSLKNEEQLEIIDQCLEFNYKVYNVPLISDWENQEEISKKIKNIEIEDLLDRNPIVLDKKSISKQLKGKTVLITGAAGSIGSEIVRQIIDFKPKKIVLLDQAETPLHHLSLELADLKPNSEIINVIADIRNRTVIDKVFKLHKPQVIYHAAAYKHVPLMEENPSQAIETNVSGTKNLSDLAFIYQVDKFVMVSTDKAVNPSNVMGASKRIAEKYVQSLQFNSNNQITKFITTRFGNVLGSNGSVVPLFTKQIAGGGPITITHPDIIRYFMTIPEACQLVLEAGAMGGGGEVYIFDMGKPVKIIDLANKMIRLAGFIPEKDIKIKIVGLRPGEKLYEELLNDTSKTLPTHHDQIMVAQEQQDEFETLHTDINALIEIATISKNDEIVAKMKKIVPEFKSMNSSFESLDKSNN
jgi:FlaA1/EpsC-like NDP-sugar epimerase